MFKFKYQGGFGLLEIMIAAGMAGAISLIFAKLMENSTRAVKNAEVRNEYIVVHNRIAALMSEELSCYETLKDISIEIDTPSELDSIIRCQESEEVDHPLAATDPLFANVKIRRCNASAPLFDSTTEYGDKNFTLAFNFKINELAAPTAGTGSGIGELEILFQRSEKGKKFSDATYDISRKIEIVFEHDGTKLIKCYNNANNMINTAVARACTGPNARFIGDVNNSADPLRCVHDVDSTTQCPPDQFLNGYTIGPHPDTGEAQTLIPNCVAITQKTSGCGPGQYVVETMHDGTVSFSCHNLPTCAPNQHLLRGPDGLMTCQTMQFSCNVNELLVIDSNGHPTCKGCSAGEVLIKTPSGWECKATTCNNSGGSGQEYFVGFDSNGQSMCRRLVTTDKACAFGGQLEVKSDGSVGMNCCPDCTLAEKANYCLGTTFIKNNSCGSVCVGTKPIKNAVPGNWFISASCSSYNYQQIERRNCQGDAECGGDNSCEGYELERRRDCTLYQNIHTFAQCAGAGGYPRQYNGNWFCSFSGASCPTGWARYNNLGSTTGYTYTASRSCAVDKCSKSCSTGSHTWQDKGLESCSVKVKCCLGSNSHGGNAVLNTVGCY